MEAYTEKWRDWTEHESQEVPFDSSVLWRWLADRYFRPLRTQQPFVDCWTERVARGDLYAAKDDRQLRLLIENRERELKKARARLANPKRLMRWKGQSGVGRMHFNWPVARQVLSDLHQGLA